MDVVVLRYLRDQIVELFYFLWSVVPFVSITPSHDFICIFNFLLGEINIRLILVPVKNKHFKWIQATILSKQAEYQISDDKLKQLKESFINHYVSLTREECLIEKEALLRHLSDEKERINTSYSKIVAYTTIALVIVPFLMNWYHHISLKKVGILIILLSYSVINAFAWIFQAIRVRGLYQSRFSDLKKSGDKQQEYIWQIYYDWQQYKRKADLFVSFVGYTEQWIFIVMVLMAIYYFYIREQFTGWVLKK